jgi:hypothetical protein
VSAPPNPLPLEAHLRAFAARLEGYELESVPRPFGASLYLRWESRGVKRQVELQVAHQAPAGVAVWATASKARKDRSLKLAALPPAPSLAELQPALEAAVDWAEQWKVQDFF